MRLIRSGPVDRTPALSQPATHTPLDPRGPGTKSRSFLTGLISRGSLLFLAAGGRVGSENVDKHAVEKRNGFWQASLFRFEASVSRQDYFIVRKSLRIEENWETEEEYCIWSDICVCWTLVENCSQGVTLGQSFSLPRRNYASEKVSK